LFLWYNVNVVIAIDGPAGSGKSTIAKMLAERLTDRQGRGFTYINSGNLYRAISLGCIRAGIDHADSGRALAFAQSAKIRCEKNRVFLGDEDVSDLLHTDEIDRFTAPLSAIVPVRHIVNALIRGIAQGCNVVAEGRDMTSVVFPDADCRFYLDASAQARARRRFDQGVSALSLAEIQAAIEERDAIDRGKAEGSLVIAQNVKYIDTSRLTLSEVYGILVESIEKEI
jgi:cytidylate kinase